MRASINVLGPLLARCGRARVAMPGGDNIGSRKLDLHMRGLQAMGAELEVVHGFIDARVNALSGARIVLDFPSVGATETLLTAAVLAKGETVIDNAAREPEITDLAAFLTKMGARIDGAGTNTIAIEGVDELVPGRSRDHRRPHRGRAPSSWPRSSPGATSPSRASRLEHLELVAAKLGDLGATVDRRARRCPRDHAIGRPRAVDIADAAVPGLRHRLHAAGRRRCSRSATAPASSPRTCSTTASPSSTSSTAWAPHVRTEGRHAVVRGVDRLSGAPVRALDVRAGAALVLAGLAAEGETVVLDAPPRRSRLPRPRRQAPRARRRRRPGILTVRYPGLPTHTGLARAVRPMGHDRQYDCGAVMSTRNCEP